MKKRETVSIGVDIGGTKLLAALVTSDGKIAAEIEQPTCKGDALIHQVLDTVQQLVETGSSFDIKGIGVASAGVIDSAKKEILYAANLGIESLKIGSLMEQEWGLPVRLYNDANAAALGEWQQGGGRGRQNVIYITVSTGIGAGIISGGSLITGRGDSAGEFGHISINLNGPACSCGNRGCLENYASGPALAALANERLNSGARSSILKPGGHLTAKEIGAAARQGDPFSISILEEIGGHLGLGLINLIHLFNTETVILGGGVMNESEILLPAIQKTIKKHGIESMVKDVDVRVSALGRYAPVLGVACLYGGEEQTKSFARPGETYAL
ncbi:ROK family protein [Peribacillus sp. SCS-37]|uniref:ROK family protein n=1 Tax=Paraperibacillus esterisolvens TaxID=3115296 RepID=UPI003905BB21